MHVMKGSLSVLLFLLVSLCYAQKGEISYVFKSSNPNQPDLRKIVYFQDGRSIELGAGLMRGKIDTEEKQVSYNQTEKNVVFSSERRLFVLKDFNKGSMELADNNFTDAYLITDTLENFKWEITQETKVLKNQPCQKATTRFRGRHYIAWFATNIPINNGPWKFSGLPGLIIQVADDEGKFSYELLSLTIYQNDKGFKREILQRPKGFAKDKAISHAAFMKLKEKTNRENEALSKVWVQQGGVQTKTFMMAAEAMELY